MTKYQLNIVATYNHNNGYDEVGLHMHNDKDCEFICEFYDSGVLEP